ncbi:MAG: tryptophan-rich sensory protein [Chlorobiaceae bacterium]|jgi:translocator protein|nr:tryptophan-rich sensory protein [Chlorobiaceae bacterium]NTV16000.1 tryptophan-rich sensory protein [Chlorobiaceae bacterium]
MGTWYENLKKPWFTPPDRVFWPVWSTIYILIFISLVLYFLSPIKPYLFVSVTLLIIHFTAGFNWTGIFFTRKKILLAFYDILVIDITLIAIIWLFFQASIPAALLLLPYLTWGLFATFLNWRIYQLNR